MRTKSAPIPTLNLRRQLRAPLLRVYAMWTDLALLRQWWAADGTTTHELTFEPRIGGIFRWVFTNAQGQHHSIHGEVFELVPREKISFTWTDDEDASSVHHDASRVTVDFREGRGVELRLHHSRLPDQATHDQAEREWSNALDRLEHALKA